MDLALVFSSHGDETEMDSSVIEYIGVKKIHGFQIHYIINHLHNII